MNYKKRTQAVQSLLKQEEVDWFIVTNPYNVRYLSGFTGSHGVLLIHPEDPIILTDGRYQEQVIQEVTGYRPVIQGQRKEIEAICDSVRDWPHNIVWFEAEHLSYDRYEEFKNTIPAKEYFGIKGIIENLRTIKEDMEIEITRCALRMAEQAIERVPAILYEGITERELAHIIEDEMWKLGAAKESFESLILFGARSSLPHGKPSDYRLKRGDPVLMDIGCVVDGYCSDITRTMFFGRPDEELKKMYDVVLRANLAAEEKICAGLECRQADALAREVIEREGRGEQFIHNLGHGVGLEIHEAPRLSPISEYTLQKGNLVTVEPGVYIAGFGGIRIEDMVVVQKDGCEVLNQLGKEMVVI